jgi:hypothetical protein
MIWLQRPIRHYYTCGLLLRFDCLLRELQGKKMEWSERGTLCEVFPNGYGVEIRTYFPGWMFLLACYIQNRFLWTRKILDYGCYKE